MTKKPVATRRTRGFKPSNDSRLLRRFGRTVRALRQLRGLTQRELADGLGLSQNYISNIEGGTREAGILLTMRLARKLKVSFDLLLLPLLDPTELPPKAKSKGHVALDLRDVILATLEELSEE